MTERRNLYFIDSNNKYRVIASDVDRESAFIHIHAFLDNANFRCYYIRSWDTNEGTMFDVGSHTEFFLWGFHEEK